jgi:8-amino-7-oxononanoate synthase
MTTPPDDRAAASLDAFACARLARLDAAALRRSVVETAPKAGALVERDGKTLINFSGNDYLGLSQHPEVKEAARQAVEDYGAGAGASRLVTGAYPLLQGLERRIAAFKRTEDAVVFGSGYLANLSITPALVGGGDLILVDALAHSCLHAGAKLSGAHVESFAHNDFTAAAAILEATRRQFRRAMLLTDGVFSMDGDIAPLPELLALADQHDVWMLVDDAHGLGVVGKGGRGAAYTFDPSACAPLQMGTLSKAVGAYGGYLAASRSVCDLIRTRAAAFIYTTSMPPAAAGAALAALDIIERDADLRARPLALAARFCRALDLLVPQSPIVPIVLGAPDAAVAASHVLAERGFLVAAIRPPTVPKGTARLRVTFSAAHTEAQIDGLVSAMRAVLR